MTKISVSGVGAGRSMLFACVVMVLLWPSLAAAFRPWSGFSALAGDEGEPAEISPDKKIATTLKTALLERDRQLGLDVKVYCFRGRVTLLGQIADDSFKAFAENAARKTRGVKSVATYWEEPGKTDTSAEDLDIAAGVRAALAVDRDVRAEDIEQEVFAGKVYLLGIVRGRADIERAVARVRSIKGVTGVVPLLVTTEKKR